MSEQRSPNLWLPPSPDPHAPSADDFRAPPEPERSPDPEFWNNGLTLVRGQLEAAEEAAAQVQPSA